MRYGAGQFDRRITLQLPLQTQNETGDAELFWSADDIVSAANERATGDGATATDDATGLSTVVNAIPYEIKNAWARVREREGKEEFDGDKLTDSQMVEFMLRYRSDVTDATRIGWNSQTYDVKSIQILGRKETIKILAERRN